LEPTSNILDRLALDLGDVHISLLTILKGLVALVALLWLANVLSHFLERRYSSLDALTPSIKVLASKVTKILLITIAILAALSIVGIDLTAFAVFSGAVGVGVGFGLQKVVSNLISGVILLLDRSIKPGDVVGVDDTYGWIKDLNARYVSVVTRDGIEHLIPNEDLISQKVMNWSYSNLQVRLKISLGISYNSDVRKAIELCLEAAAAVERVIDEPRTVCLVKGFGDSSVDLEIRIWIQDPQNGISNVKSQVLLGVWDRFHEHGIEIPFPQRDIHLRSSIPVHVEPKSE
jgi:small-conductance mechanosensitive channel